MIVTLLSFPKEYTDSPIPPNRVVPTDKVLNSRIKYSTSSYSLYSASHAHATLLSHAINSFLPPHPSSNVS
jgi:hypothetical protein